MTDIVPAFLESTFSRVDQHKQISNNTSTEQIVMWYGTLKKKKNGVVWEESNKGIVLSLPWSRKVSLTLPYGKTPQPSGPHFLCWGNICLSCGRIPISQEAPALRIGEEGYSPLTISYWQLVFQHCGKWGHPPLHAVKNLSITLQSGLPIRRSTSVDSADHGSYSTMVCVYWKKKSCIISGPMLIPEFIPMLLKGRL